MSDKPFKPYFLVIPMELIEDPDLDPLDRIVFAVIYWYERLQTGTCTASNRTIGAMLGVHERSIQKSIERLDHQAHISRRVVGRNRFLTTISSIDHAPQGVVTETDHAPQGVVKPVLHAPQGVPVSNQRIKGNSKDAKMRHRQTESHALVAEYTALYPKKISRDRAPVFNSAQCHAMAKRRISELGLGRMIVLLGYYLDSTDKFWDMKGWPLSLFLSADTIHALNSADGPIITPKRRAQ